MALTPLRRLAVLVSTVAVALALGAPVAVAHGGGAVFDVLEAYESAPGQLRVVVSVVHESDRHPAEGAIVEVAATGPDGAEVPAQPAEREEPGVYGVTLDLPEPGDWTVSVTSSFPPGRLAIPVTIALEEAATSDPTSATTTTPATPTTAGPPAPTVEAGPVEGAAERDETLSLIVAGVCGIIGGGLGLWVSNRRGRRKRAASTSARER